MLKSTHQLSNILIRLHTLLLVSLLLVYSSCGQKEEEDATKNATDLLNQQYGGGDPSEYFFKAIQLMSDPNSTPNQVEGGKEAAIGVINNKFELLDTNPESEQNVLYILLTAISQVTKPDGLVIRKGSRIDNYLTIFKALRDNNVKLDITLLEKLKNKAINAENGEQEAIYYPLVVLGGMTFETQVKYQDQFDRSEGYLHILNWVILSRTLNKVLKKEMVEILVRNSTEKPSDHINTITKAEGKDMTPAMFAAYKALSSDNDEESAYNAEIFKIFLMSPRIRLLEAKANLPSQEDKKLNGQPLLSFIIYNCVRKNIKNHEAWLQILDEALKSGELKAKSKNNRKAIKQYLKDYISPVGGNTPSEFDNPDLYNTEDMAKVREKLNTYTTEV